MSFKPVTHVLFDMDGLILNTEDLYTIGFQNVASRYGKYFTFELKCKIMGRQSKEIAASIIDDLELPLTVDEFVMDTRIIFRELFPESKILPEKEVNENMAHLMVSENPCPGSCNTRRVTRALPAFKEGIGVERLIRHLDAHDVPIGLATNGSLETYDYKVQKHSELFDLLKYKTFGSSEALVKRGKPYPDIFLVAAAKFPDNPAPEKVLVFEDSINGVKAAHSAGMQVVMIPDPRLDRSLAPEATLILDTMMDFRPEMFGLPPYKIF